LVESEVLIRVSVHKQKHVCEPARSLTVGLLSTVLIRVLL